MGGGQHQGEHYKDGEGELNKVNFTLIGLTGRQRYYLVVKAEHEIVSLDFLKLEKFENSLKETQHGWGRSSTL